MKLHNTLTRQIEQLHPLTANEVRIYTCGLTVYSQPHIGNWTGYIYWDVLVRCLTESGYTVHRTQNITDVGHLVSDDDDGSDKMEVGARREGVTAWDIAAKYSSIADHEAYALLGLIRPTHLVRATDYIKQQITFVEDLEAQGYTYTIPDEGVYFDTSKLDDYGRLAKLDIEGLQEGARVSIAGKRNATDFAVWKFSPADQKRDMEWDSPWGKGFPGWHLECSVIARETLGDQIDIHTGGVDHIPVHHTNEIAQTEAVTGKQFSQFWVHNNHLKVDGGKMSKSLGNIHTLQDIVEKGYSLQAYKLLVLSKHYRTEGNFTWEILEAAENRLHNWKNVAVLRHQTTSISANRQPGDDDLAGQTHKSVLAALADDLDTPGAIVAVETALDAIAAGQTEHAPAILSAINRLLGIDLEESTPDITDDQKQLIATREEARLHKDWARSDELRHELETQGIQVKDTPAGTIWGRL